MEKQTYFNPELLGQKLIEEQGELMDYEFAAKNGVIRQTLRAIKLGLHMPSPLVLARFGYRMGYSKMTPKEQKAEIKRLEAKQAERAKK